MKKFELVREVAKQTGISQDVVNKVIDATSDVIVKNVMEGDGEVNLPALGKFKLKVNPAREGINPLNKQKISIKESRTIAFRPTSAIKRVVD